LGYLAQGHQQGLAASRFVYGFQTGGQVFIREGRSPTPPDPKAIKVFPDMSDKAFVEECFLYDLNGANPSKGGDAKSPV
jgi:hypothetical protein